MNWTIIFRDVLQPILFFGLFLMTFISMLINIRVERRAIAKHERDIVQSAKLIKRNYELLKEAAKGHEHLQKVLEGEMGRTASGLDFDYAPFSSAGSEELAPEAVGVQREISA